MTDCTAAPPINCDIPAERTTSLPAAAGPLEVPPAFSNRLLTYELGGKVHEVLSLRAHTRAVADYNTVLRLHEEIISIWHGIHPALQPNNPDTSWDARYPLVEKQREYAKIHANSTLLTLHREHACVHEFSRKAAIKAAHGSLAAQDKLFHMLPPNQHRIYGLSRHSIDAATFVAYNFLGSLRAGPVELTQFDETIMAVQKSIDRLNRMQGCSQMAFRGASMLWRPPP
ncbi:uncharacterized protein DNG_04685 [Cephalotrichum gorgonifer]|uniref:Uncharacterized protein n=1 Tax=Cephalotrichum gorgonifer TaxID=2041049 RepID=A0AAE8SVJ5_9PEZI|nr:uncharacterized protein DNG_04685 [Cephalotrichum gorgonifer]